MSDKLIEIFFPLDVPSVGKACALMRELAPHVDVFKLGLETLHHNGTPQIVRIAHEYEKKIMIDCKISDIPATVAAGVAGVALCDIDYLNIVMGNCQRSAAEKAVEKINDLSDRLEDEGMAVPEIIAVTLMTSWEFQDLIEHGILPPPWWEFVENEDKQTELIVDMVMNREVGGVVPDRGGDQPFRLPESDEEKASFCTYVALKWGKIAYESGIRMLLSSPREAKAFKLAFPDCEFISPGIRPPWSKKDDQKRTMTPGEAYLCGVTKQVIGRPIRNARDAGLTRKEAIRLIREDVQKAHDSMKN